LTIYTTREAANITGLTVRALRKRIERGQLQAVQHGRYWHIPRSELERVGLIARTDGQTSNREGTEVSIILAALGRERTAHKRLARELNRRHGDHDGSARDHLTALVTPAAIAPLGSLIESMDDPGRRMVRKAITGVAANDPRFLREFVQAAVREDRWSELAPLVLMLPPAARSVVASAAAQLTDAELVKLVESATRRPRALRQLLSLIHELPADRHKQIAAAISQRPPVLVKRMLRRAQTHDPDFTLDQLPPPIRKVVARSARATDPRQT
jgi:excisionase family DNA binding protein